MKAYEFEPIHARMFLDELLDVTVCHPLRNHGESVLSHDHPYQRQHVWMAERFPGDDFSTEPLQHVRSVHRYSQGENPAKVGSPSSFPAS